MAVVAGNVSPKALNESKTRLEATKAILETQDPDQLDDLNREDLLGELFHAGLLGYYGQFTALSYVAGLRQGAHHYLAAGIGTFGYEPSVNYTFGIPQSIHGGGAAMNIPIVNIYGHDGDGSQDAKQNKLNYVLQIGTLSSALEHAVPEQMFVTAENPGEAISAVKALGKASAAGQRIYHLTQANRSTVLPLIHHNDLVMNEISNALATGKEVITHTDTVAVPGWSGAGYIIYDPVTGDGAYKIGGGENGVFLLIIGFILMAIFLNIAAYAFIAGLLIHPGIAAGILVTMTATIMSINDIKNIWTECDAFGAALLTFAIVIQQIAQFLVGVVAIIVDALSISLDVADIIPEPTDDPICEL